MKSIYKFAFLSVLATGALTSCEEEGVETIMLGSETEAMVIESLSPSYGFPGDEFEIVGKNFACAKELFKVKLGQQNVKVISATDDRIRAYVPMDATSGIVTVSLLDKQASSDEVFKVLGKPSVEGISAEWGFVGDDVTFYGSLLGTCAEDIKLMFGTSRVAATITDWSENQFTATIPLDATTGRLRLMVVTQNVNTPIEEFTIRQHGNVTSVSPATVYAGNKFTIAGNFLGEPTEACALTIGGQKAEVLSWSENAIEAIIPVGTSLKAGQEYAIAVTTPYETIESDKTVTLRNAPAITAVDPVQGYVGTKVTFAGENLPDAAEDLTATVNGNPVTVEGYKVSNGKGSFSISIPAGVEAGKVKIAFAIGQLSFYDGEFTVLNTPSLLSVDEKLVRAGETITIKGEYLGTSTSGVKVTVAGVAATVKAIQPNAITIVVPALSGNTLDAKVELEFPGTPAFSDVTLNVMAGSGDVTDMVLKNAHAPYSWIEDKLDGGFATPTDWQFNESMYVDGQLIYPLLVDSGFPTGVLGFWCHRWTNALHKNYIESGKIYQTVSLPAGDYELIADVAECNLIGGDIGIALGVAPGELPDIIGVQMDFAPIAESEYLQNPDGSYAYTMLSQTPCLRAATETAPVIHTVKFTLTERTTVTIGITGTATMRGGNGCSFELRRLTVNTL